LSRLDAVAIPADPPPTITTSWGSPLAFADSLDMFRSLLLGSCALFEQQSHFDARRAVDAADIFVMGLSVLKT
jgi:hypothetical protein